jgi:hypothetical protein
LGERLLCKQEVIGSIPFTSTILKGRRQQMKMEIVAWFRSLRDQKQAARLTSGLLTGEAVRSLTIWKKQVHRSPKIDAWVVIAFKTVLP